MSITQRVELVTPEKAKAYLEKNHSNRPIRKYHVNMFIDRLQTETFSLTHQGIALSDTGILLDGQHRLAAIVASGISAEMTVAEGVSEEAFQNMDCGIQRKMSDRVIFDAENPVRNSRLTGVCSALIIKTSSTKGKDLNTKPSAKAVIECYDKYGASIRAIVDEIFFQVPRGQKQVFCGNRNILATCVLLHSYSAIEGIEFTSKLFMGAPFTSVEDPVAICRSYLTSHPRLKIRDTLSRIYWAINKNHDRVTAKTCGRMKMPWFLKSSAKDVQ